MNRLSVTPPIAVALTLATGVLAAACPADARIRLGARPQAQCDGFVLANLTASKTQGGGGAGLDAGIGYMHNTSERSAFGGELRVLGSPSSVRPALLAHVRRWVSPTTSLDVGPGLLIGDMNAGGIGQGRLGAVLEASVMHKDRCGLAIGAEVSSTELAGTEWMTRVGIRFGSAPALIAGGTLGVLALAMHP
jgi:hypothetical protein